MIHKAVEEGRGEVVSFLIESVVDPNEMDSLNERPINYACSNNHVVVEILLKLKCKANLSYNFVV